MNNEPSWLTVTVFLSKKYWALAIRDIIKPYIETLQKIKDLQSFSFSFSDLGGDNIRLALLTDFENKFFIKKIISDRFDDFFKHHELPIEAILRKKDLGTLIFMPHYQNTVIFDLFNQKTTPNFSFLQTIENQLYLIALSVFSNEDIIDEEVLLTFSVYLLFICYKVLHKYGNNFGEKWLNFYNQKVTVTYHKTVYSVYNMFVDSANEIYQQIFNNGEKLEWMDIWEKAFDRIFNDAIERNQSEYILRYFDKLLNHTLCINHRMEMILGALVSETIGSKQFVSFSPMMPE